MTFILAIVQARTNSQRFPQKILQKINGKSILEIQLTRLMKSQKIDELLIATTKNPGDDMVCEIAYGLGLKSYRGSENDVLGRFYQAALPYDPKLVDDVIEYTVHHGVDYCSNVLKEEFPDGQDVEVFTFKALKRSWKEANIALEREHVTTYIRNNGSYNGGEIFKTFNYPAPGDFGHIRITVDEPEDLKVIQLLISHLGEDMDWVTYANFVQQNEQLRKINSHISRNQGFKSQ